MTDTPEDAAPTLHAWVDESMHASIPGVLDGAYFLAATIADPSQCDVIRDELKGLLVGKNRRLHWRDESPKRQRTIAATIAKQSLAHTVVVGVPLNIHKRERARRLCLERLLLELASRGVSQVWIESRKDAMNRRDQAMVAALRSKVVVPRTLVVDFGVPAGEPMLWVPDAVAGAVNQHHRGEDSRSRTALGNAVVEIAVTLT